MNRLDLRAWSLIFFILLSLAGVNALGSQINVEVKLTGQMADNVLGVGPIGPIKFEFSRAVQEEMVTPLVSFNPPIPGIFIWDDFTHARFVPDQSILPNILYSVTIGKGVVGRSGEKIPASFSWKFKVREPLVIYMSGKLGVVNLWTASLSKNQPPQQITQAEGVILDYAPSPNGEQIIYSMLNSVHGIDLWIVDRDGQQNHILLTCGLDRCSTITWNKDSQRIVYDRESAGVSADAPLGAPRPWLLDTRTGETAPLYDDPQFLGYAPSWSPDGQKIASFDGIKGGIQILDLKTKKNTFLPTTSGMVGNWSLDSQFMYFTNTVINGTDNKVQVLKADVNSGQTEQLFTSENLASNTNFDVPLISPKGDWLAVGTQVSQNTPGSQIWLVSENGDQIQAVTNGSNFTYDEYSWNPAGNKLVFRGLRLGSSGSKNTTSVWDLPTQQITLIAENSSMPFWLP